MIIAPTAEASYTVTEKYSHVNYQVYFIQPPTDYTWDLEAPNKLPWKSAWQDATVAHKFNLPTNDDITNLIRSDSKYKWSMQPDSEPLGFGPNAGWSGSTDYLFAGFKSFGRVLVNGERVVKASPEEGKVLLPGSTYHSVVIKLGGCTFDDNKIGSCYSSATTIFMPTYVRGIRFNPNGGTGTVGMDSPQMQGNDPNNDWLYTVRESPYTRPGYTFTGWNTKADGSGTEYHPGDVVNMGKPQFMYNYSDNKTTSLRLYAQWKTVPVSLSYDTNKPSAWNGQMPSTPASVSVPYNTAAADGSGWRAGDTSKLRGYRFLGWYSKPQDGAGLYDWTRPLTGNVTVYAHWQRLQANVIYDKNASDAKGSHANTTGWQYSDVTIPGDTSKSFKRTGYRFAGWNTAKDGKGTAYVDGSKVPLQDKDVTLYAQWAPLFDVLPSAGGDYGPSVPWLVCGGLALVALVGGVASTLLRLRRARGAHSR